MTQYPPLIGQAAPRLLALFGPLLRRIARRNFLEPWASDNYHPSAEDVRIAMILGTVSLIGEQRIISCGFLFPFAFLFSFSCDLESGCPVSPLISNDF